MRNRGFDQVAEAEARNIQQQEERNEAALAASLMAEQEEYM
jgi:hypothetical protein